MVQRRYPDAKLYQAFTDTPAPSPQGETPSSVADKLRTFDSHGITLSEMGMQQLSAAASKSASTAYQPTPSYSVPAPIAPFSLFGSPQVGGSDSQPTTLGNFNSNKYDPNSVSNPYGQYGSPYSPKSVHNPYGVYGSPYSPYSATNPYTTQAPTIVAPNGQYLGRFSSNPYDPDSVSNPYGQYGSRYSPTSVNNPYGVYGSPYSPYSATNPYATQAPTIVAPSGQPLGTPSLPTLPRVPAGPSLPKY